MAGFSFTPHNFDNLHNLPHFVNEDGQLSDFPEHSDAIVALGYTLGTYKSRSGDAQYLSTNLMFAILLLLPNDV